MRPICKNAPLKTFMFNAISENPPLVLSHFEDSEFLKGCCYFSCRYIYCVSQSLKAKRVNTVRSLATKKWYIPSVIYNSGMDSSKLSVVSSLCHRSILHLQHSQRYVLLNKHLFGEGRKSMYTSSTGLVLFTIDVHCSKPKKRKIQAAFADTTYETGPLYSQV